MKNVVSFVCLRVSRLKDKQSKLIGQKVDPQSHYEGNNITRHHTSLHVSFTGYETDAYYEKWNNFYDMAANSKYRLHENNAKRQASSVNFLPLFVYCD